MTPHFKNYLAARILDLQKCCKTSIESLWGPCLADVNSWEWWKPGNEQECNTVNWISDPFEVSPVVLIMSFHVPGSNPRFSIALHCCVLVSFHLWRSSFFPWLSWYALVISTGQLLSRSSLILGFSSVFSWLDWGYGFWGFLGIWFLNHRMLLCLVIASCQRTPDLMSYFWWC